MAKTNQKQIESFIKQVETAAKRLRADIRKQAGAAGLEKRLRKTAADLDKQATAVRRRVGTYIERLWKEIKVGRKKSRAKVGTKRASSRKR